MLQHQCAVFRLNGAKYVSVDGVVSVLGHILMYVNVPFGSYAYKNARRTTK